MIRKNHGKDCDTFKTAKQHLTAYIEAFKAWVLTGNCEADWSPVQCLREFVYEFECEADDVTNDFRRALLEDYLSMLCREYDWQTSSEQIIESIKVNGYEFTEGGKLA